MKPNTAKIHPPLELLMGPAGSGKTNAVLRRVCESPRHVVLVVTSTAQSLCLAQRATVLVGPPTNDASRRIVPFSAITSEILRHERQEKRTPIGRGFQRIILGTLVPSVISRSDFLGKMLDAPGFVSAFQERLREWKVTGIVPGDFAAAASIAETDKRPQLARKLRDIERIFVAYEQFLLDNRLRDEEDGLVRAAELIEAGEAPIPWDARQIIVHGFYRFTVAQLNLLRACAARRKEGAVGAVSRDANDGAALKAHVVENRADFGLAVTLPWDNERPLLFAAPARTLARLRAEFATHEINLLSRSDGKEARRDSLARLRAHLFGSGTSRSAESADPAQDTLNRRPGIARSIQILEAPNPYVEAEMIAREFRLLHERDLIPWSDFAVILRSIGDYAPILSAVFERYNVPIGADGPEICINNPLVKTVLALLAVVRDGWRRDDVLGFLKSSYTAPDTLAVDGLRKRAWSAAVREGREEWQTLVEGDSMDWQGWSGGGDQPIRVAIREMLHFDSLFNAGPAETRYFVALIREAVVAFGLEERIDSGEPTRSQRDRSALKEAMSSLDNLVRIAEIRSTGPIHFSKFHGLVCDAWENASAFPVFSPERVHVLEPHASRERDIRVAAVMGLTERVFPRRVIEDAFLRDEERRLLDAWMGLDLEEQRLRADDERFLFYLAVTAPTERLLLSYPRAAHENDTLPSFFLDEVRRIFESPPGLELHSNPTGSSGADSLTPGLEVVIRTLADVAPRAQEADAPSDRLLAACADLFDPQGEVSLRPQLARKGADRVRALFADVPGSEQLGHSVLASRNLPRLPALQDADLFDRFTSGKSVFTVSELEDYARCPFQYLARHVWMLKPEIEGLDAGKQSALLHTVLRRYFRARVKRGESAVSASESGRVFMDLQRLLNACLQETRQNAGAHHLRILRRRLTDDLMGFALREARFAEKFGSTPTHFHVSFGRAAKTVAPDPLSCPQPLVLSTADGASSVAISGFIDRVDVDESGRRALVLEYETGRPPEFAAIQRGESLQMPINLLAIERLFGMHAAGACYDSMQEAGRRRFHRTEHVNIRDFAPMLPFDEPSNVKPLSREQFNELVGTAEAAAVRLATAIRTGRIDAMPGPHCRTCDFRDVCRTSQVDGHDGQRLIAQ